MSAACMPYKLKINRSVMGINLLVLLLLALFYYFRPFWWETYRYENDQVRVQLMDASNSTVRSSLAGTLAVRISGRGMERCGWGHSPNKNATGNASDALITIDSIESSFTDDLGYVKVSPYQGIASGRRNLLGGCLSNRGFVVLLSRPDYTIKKIIPQLDTANASFHTLTVPTDRGDSITLLQHARNTLVNHSLLLYPFRNLGASAKEQVLMTMPAYWKHELPNGDTIRRYAIQHLLRVNDSLNCPRLQDQIRQIFAGAKTRPEEPEAIEAEYAALEKALDRTLKDKDGSCQ